MDQSPEGRIAHLPRPRFRRGADVKKKQDVLEGKLKQYITENTISLLFAQALVQEKEWVCGVDLQTVCWLQLPMAAVFQKLHLKGTAMWAQVRRQTSLIQLESRIPVLHLNRATWISTSIMCSTALDYKIHGKGTGSLLTF